MSLSIDYMEERRKEEGTINLLPTLSTLSVEPVILSELLTPGCTSLLLYYLQTRDCGTTKTLQKERVD